MRLLLDTHICIWLFRNDVELSEEARKLFNDDNEIYYSVLSVWEIAIKENKAGKLNMSARQFTEAAKKAGLKCLPLTEKQISSMVYFKNNKDPFDNMLFTQATAENMQFVTHDKNIVSEAGKQAIAV